MAGGRLRAVVATSSLDLGIDWGGVDQVIQIGAPKGVSRLLQRVGRANHRMDEASRAILVPANRFEVLECEAAMLGVTARPTRVDDMIMPPQAHGLKVISIGMFTAGNDAVVWRGPMLHRALQQFLADVFWGDLDVLLLDLPPGTGDIAISTAQLIPNAELLIVTTPQQAAAEVAERAGSIAVQTRQRVVGVVENMSWMELPDGSRMDVFGTGGGQTVADSLTRILGAKVPLLGQVPLEPRVRECGDTGTPVVLAAPDSPAATAMREVAEKLAVRSRGLAGMSLGLSPVQR